MNRLGKIILFLMVVITGLGLTGCKMEDTDVKKLNDLEFTVVEDADVPEELMEIINDKKVNPFKLSYSNTEYLYIVVGYGKQNSGGYSIAVEDLYLTSNAIYIDTNLIGPSQQDLVTQGTTYPYIVVKLEFLDKSVVFN